MNRSPKEDDVQGWLQAMLDLGSVQRYGLEIECTEVFNSAIKAGDAPRDAVHYALDEWDVLGEDGVALLVADPIEDSP